MTTDVETETPLPKLLRAIAGGTQAKQNRHDVIFNAAADEIDRLREENKALRQQDWDALAALMNRYRSIPNDRR